MGGAATRWYDEGGTRRADRKWKTLTGINLSGLFSTVVRTMCALFHDYEINVIGAIANCNSADIMTARKCIGAK